jgi:cell division protein FtsB
MRNTAANVNWPSQLWVAGFLISLLLLSGVPGEFLGSSPGALQLIRLTRLVEQRRAQADAIQNEIRRLEAESTLLQSNKAVQQREIRRILGYTAPDELIFDFTTQAEAGR